MTHGKLICRECDKVIAQCRCMEGHGFKSYSVCDECKKKKLSDNVSDHNVCDTNQNMGESEELSES